MSGNKVYAVASGKGGVGKTTTSVNLGAMLAELGYDVVVVDTDLAMANLAGFLGVEVSTPTLHEVLAGEAAVEAAIRSAPGDVDVLPSATDIEAFAKSDSSNLRPVVERLRDTYDYVIIDTGAGVSYDTILPLAIADAVLLVATPDVASVRDAAKTGELTRRVDGTVAGAVLTQRSSDILSAEDVEGELETDVLAVVPADEAVPMGIDAGRPLAAFAPNTPAANAYRTLAEVISGRITDPNPDLSGRSTDEPADPSARPEGGADDVVERVAETAGDAPSASADAPVASDEEIKEVIDNHIMNESGAGGPAGPTGERAGSPADDDDLPDGSVRFTDDERGGDPATTLEEEDDGDDDGLFNIFGWLLK